MSKNDKTKSVTSIAIKLNSISVRNLFIKFFVLDICLVCILIGTWCLKGEMDFYGQIVADAKRFFNFYPITTAQYKCAGKGYRTGTRQSACGGFV